MTAQRRTPSGLSSRPEDTFQAGATIAADNGATEHQLMAIFGWESPKQAALYTRKANRRKLAGAGMQFIDLGDLDGVEEIDDPNSEDET
ncbi:hypothetical protein [Bosea sp. (in: a-proteobacteria)]|uniref:hypothetical protein n=1 Tax=Bosea sp. (in: a-proteobacteria) TaxID=1871050 RepID=UPI001AC0EDAE|nr:hypothetical protein [Bosea sp. (in: a-proteobacteria)]MBN9437009.1 hypothetical protein [Bosea sp. (in: a-proteobacteria)]